MKKEFVEPKIEIVEIEDIIVTSIPGQTTNPNGGGGWSEGEI